MTPTTEQGRELREWIEDLADMTRDQWAAAAAGLIIRTPAGKMDASLITADPYFTAHSGDASFADFLVETFDDEARVTPEPPTWKGLPNVSFDPPPP